MACALAAAALVGMFIVGTRDFALDDAWIHLSYAKSLRLGQGLSYNPSDWETGFSSPLWVLVLSVWPIAGDPVVPVKLLGALLHAATAYSGAWLAWELGQQRGTDEHPVPLLSITLLAGVLVGMAPTLLASAASGMEVALAAALLTAATRDVVRGHVGSAALWSALATWARPESVFMLGLLGGSLAAWRWRAGNDRRGVRAAVSCAVGALLALGAWVVYSLVVSGYPWPNTSTSKAPAAG